MLALSGGGDSLALLHLATGWARDHGRRVLALTVDHGLAADSARWTAFARDAATAAGADWRGLVWSGSKPATGLPAAARRARHRLIAEAARTAGARVVLFGHTAGDVAESDLMRSEGTALGRLRDWAPSPAWPEGRGLMLLRPMLDVGRAELRAWLAARQARWIDDPANDDPAWARSRARRRLVSTPTVPPSSPRADAGPLPRLTGADTILVERTVSAATLAAVVVCAGGGDRPPRGDRLAGVRTRLGAGEIFTATLCGARIEASADQVLVTREAGEFARRQTPPQPLASGVASIWDGRWSVRVAEPGWSVVPAVGQRAALSRPDRARLNRLPPAARGGRPVLIRNGHSAPVLAEAVAMTRALIEERLTLALGRVTQEIDLVSPTDGETPPNPLFSDADIIEQGGDAPSQGPGRV